MSALRGVSLVGGQIWEGHRWVRGKVHVGKTEGGGVVPGLLSLKAVLKPLEQLYDCLLLQQLCFKQFTVTQLPMASRSHHSSFLRGNYSTL